MNVNCPHCDRRFRSEYQMLLHECRCPVKLRDRILPLLADEANPGYAVHLADYARAASAHRLPSTGAVHAVGGYASFCAIFNLRIPAQIELDFDGGLAEVRRLAEALGYPEGVACSRADYERGAPLAYPRSETMMRHFGGKLGRWSDVATAAGLRAETRNYYLSVAHQRRVQANADALLAALGEVAEQRKRIAAEDDDAFVLHAIRNYEVPGSRRIERRNDGTVAVRYEVATVLR